MASETSFELTPEERGYFQRLFRRTMWPFVAAAAVVATLMWVVGIQPLRDARESSDALAGEHGGLALDLRTEVARLVRELVSEPNALGKVEADPRVARALGLIEALGSELEKSRKRVIKLEQRVGEFESSVPAAVPAGDVEPAVEAEAIEAFRARVFAVELRQDRSEEKQQELETARAESQRRIEERLTALENRLADPGF